MSREVWQPGQTKKLDRFTGNGPSTDLDKGKSNNVKPIPTKMGKNPNARNPKVGLGPRQPKK
jgi:hypothetical protein